MRRFDGAGAAVSRENELNLGLMLEIKTPALLPELVKHLAASGCVTRPVDDRVCHVVHLEAVDATEEWNEIRFFLRAWQASQGGVEVSLRSDQIQGGGGAAGSG